MGSGKVSIRMYWWRPKGPPGTNIGDEIGPIIVEALSGRAVERSSLDECDMISVGSILQHAVKDKTFQRRSSPIHVWGSGNIGPRDLAAESINYVFHAVRGPLTRKTTGAPGHIPLGDPGLLVADVFPAAGSKEFAWGIIPHHTQLDSPRIKGLLESTPRSTLIDVTSPDIENTLTLLASCEQIASTSLHGIIFADAYRIPNVWLFFGPLHVGGPWKFLDYFGSLGLPETKPVKAVPKNNLNKLAGKNIRRPANAAITAAKRGLLSSLPTDF